tara:strand:+ start:57 stop:338 length:282 start_codon:yes stop_codon:yes gene_type:complete
MFKIIIVFLLLNFYTTVFSSTKEEIISQMKLINVLSFDFIQTTNKKRENGSCIIRYPKKIYCEYDSSSKKIIVSDGKSLVIKNKNSKNNYIYP